MLIFSLVMLFLFFLLLKKSKRNFFLMLIATLGCFVFSLVLFYEILYLISSSSSTGEFLSLVIAYLAIPLAILLVVFFFIKNTKTMSTKEGRSLTAKLSAGLGINLLIVVFFSFFYFVYGLNVKLNAVANILVTFALVTDILFTIYFVLYLMYSVFYQLVPVDEHIDYIIVLGAGIKDENVTPLLKSRLDKAIEYYNKNEQCKIVVSGGQGADEPVSEAYAMKKYLLSQKIPEGDILYEDQSTSTYENMLFSKKIIEQDYPDLGKYPTIYFSTNNYHVLRGAIYAKQVKLKASGIGAPTAFYFLPSALIREYIALLTHYKWFTILNLIAIGLFILYSL
jgi:uncharacterized SAM-binding protein YcdF (DUF218 family)